MKITRFDRPTIGMLRGELAAALAPVAKHRDLVIEIGPGNFTRENLTLKIEIATKGDGGTVQTQARVAFQVHCNRYGFIPEDIDRKFELNGTMYKIVGLNPNAPKFPIIAESTRTGTKYKFTPQQVTRGLL